MIASLGRRIELFLQIFLSFDFFEKSQNFETKKLKNLKMKFSNKKGNIGPKKETQIQKNEIKEQAMKFRNKKNFNLDPKNEIQDQKMKFRTKK